MNKWRILLMLLMSFRELSAQYSFQNLRFTEDYAYLRHDSAGNWYRRFKFNDLNRNPHWYISQGGEVRYQFQHYTNENWGDIPVDRYNAFYTRFLYHADLHYADKFRLFIQANSTFATGRVTPNRSIDQNVLDIQQVFIDLTPRDGLTFRLGRQEQLYGSQRIISVREGPNNRQSYDAIKFIWAKKNFRLDGYYAHPVTVQNGIFDDRFNKDEKLWSVYAVSHAVPALQHIDVYYIGYAKTEKEYNSGTASELRHSVGTRIWNRTSSWYYDFEALYQFGQWGDQVIHAYTASIDLGYTFTRFTTKPTIGLKTELISGDKDTSDHTLNTFNPLFPRGAYFGLAALIGPVNLIDIHPSASFRFLKAFEFSADYDIFWRYSLQDGIYGPNVALIFDANSGNRFIGHQFGASVQYQPNAFITLTPEALWFLPGPYLADVSPGKQVFFAAFTAQFKF